CCRPSCGTARLIADEEEQCRAVYPGDLCKCTDRFGVHLERMKTTEAAEDQRILRKLKARAYRRTQVAGHVANAGSMRNDLGSPYIFREKRRDLFQTPRVMNNDTFCSLENSAVQMEAQIEASFHKAVSF